MTRVQKTVRGTRIRDLVAAVLAAMIASAASAARAETPSGEPPRPLSMEEIFQGRSRAPHVTPIPGASAISILDRIYGRYAEVLTASGAPVAIQVREIATDHLSRLGRRPPAELLDAAPGKRLRVSRQVISSADGLKSAVRYRAVLDDADDADLGDLSPEDRLPLFKQVQLAARTDSTWRSVDQVTVFEVSLVFTEEAVTYRGLAYWLAATRSGYSRVILFDPVADLVAFAAVEDAHIVSTTEDIFAPAAEPGVQGLAAGHCVADTAEFENLPTVSYDVAGHKRNDVGGQPIGDHGVGAAIAGWCSTTASCLTSCTTPRFDEKFCRDWGRTEGVHRVYQNEQLSPGAGTYNGGSTCVGAVGCAVEQCATQRVCKGITVTVGISVGASDTSVSMQLGGRGAPIWSHNATSMRTCPEGVPVQYSGGRPSPFRDTPDPPTGWPGGVGSPWGIPGGSCDFVCRWTFDPSTRQYRNDCELICM